MYFLNVSKVPVLGNMHNCVRFYASFLLERFGPFRNLLDEKGPFIAQGAIRGSRNIVI
jgi:hypothetical protein